LALGFLQVVGEFLQLAGVLLILLRLLVGSHKSNEPPRDFLLKIVRFSAARVSSLAVRVCEESASHEEQNFGGR
jgi:hypothetical protein